MAGNKGFPLITMAVLLIIAISGYYFVVVPSISSHTTGSLSSPTITYSQQVSSASTSTYAGDQTTQTITTVQSGSTVTYILVAGPTVTANNPQIYAGTSTFTTESTITRTITQGTVVSTTTQVLPVLSESTAFYCQPGRVCPQSTIEYGLTIGAFAEVTVVSLLLILLVFLYRKKLAKAI